MEPGIALCLPKDDPLAPSARHGPACPSKQDYSVQNEWLVEKIKYTRHSLSQSSCITRVGYRVPPTSLPPSRRLTAPNILLGSGDVAVSRQNPCPLGAYLLGGETDNT